MWTWDEEYIYLDEPDAYWAEFPIAPRNDPYTDAYNRPALSDDTCTCENSHCPTCLSFRGKQCENLIDHDDPRVIMYLGAGYLCRGCADEYVALGYLMNGE